MRIELEKITNRVLPQNEYICMFRPNGKWFKTVFFGYVDNNHSFKFGLLDLRMKDEDQTTPLDCLVRRTCISNHIQKASLTKENMVNYVWFRISWKTIETFNQAQNISDIEKIFSLITESTGLKV